MWLKFGWLIILPPGVGWDVMGYESDPLPSHLGLSSCSYYIMLSYAESTSTPQVHLPRPIPAISPSGSSLSSAPPQHRVHIWSNSSPLPLWLPAASWFNLLWCELPLIPLQSPPGSIPYSKIETFFGVCWRFCWLLRSIDCWWLGNGGQDSDKHVGRLFEVS